jgi:pantoate--beta-alanine ligase
MAKPETIRDPKALQARALDLKRSGKTICVVPTMGALHEGHRALIAEGRKRADILIVTIFVNPTQFAPNEDLDAYPRTFDADQALCAAEGVDFIFFPTSDAMYAPHHTTWVEAGSMGTKLCGASRPTHFRGVTTVVAKLFLLTQADVAIFGWKDAQQLFIIRRMARDLDIPVDIIGIDTVREADGLAMSSRNRYLTPHEREQAPALCRALREAYRRYEEEGLDDCAALKQGILDHIARETDGRVDYVEIVSTETFDPLDRIAPSATLIALAVFFGKTRLIDNVRI